MPNFDHDSSLLQILQRNLERVQMSLESLLLEGMPYGAERRSDVLKPRIHNYYGHGEYIEFNLLESVG